MANVTEYFSIARMIKRQKKERRNLNVTVIGNNVGKTPIATSLLGYEMEYNRKCSTLELAERKRSIHGLDVLVKINEINTDGEFLISQVEAIENAHVVLIVFSRDSHDTFKHAIDVYNCVKNLENVLTAFVGTGFCPGGQFLKRVRSKTEMKKEIMRNYNSIYFEFSKRSHGDSILQKLFEEVEIKRGPYRTTTISMNDIKVLNNL